MAWFLLMWLGAANQVPDGGSTGSASGSAPHRTVLDFPNQKEQNKNIMKPLSHRADPAVIEALRDRLAALGRRSEDKAEIGSLSLGGLDSALPWGGLPLTGVHEIAGAVADGAALGFAVHLLARFAARRAPRPVLWIAAAEPLYAPGLAQAGLVPERFLFVAARNLADRLWALEEALRSGRLAAALAEVSRLPPTASRRLQLAAEAGGSPGLLLHEDGGAIWNGMLTSWRVTAAPAGRWRLELCRCRGGVPRGWMVERNDAASDFNMVADLRDGSDQAALAAG
jgi:protein ImuA